MKVIKWMFYNLSDLYSNETILTLMHCAHPFDRENTNDLKRNGIMVLMAIASVALVSSWKWNGQMRLYTEVAKRIIHGSGMVR